MVEEKVIQDEANIKENEEIYETIGGNALTLLKNRMGILIHCNSENIDKAKHDTALAPIYLGVERGYNFKIYSDETTPLLQGDILTYLELKKLGADITLISSNMASMVMKEGKIQTVLVECDRIAANGDIANEIGISGTAILAKHYGIPFYVCAPLSTIDLNCAIGDDIHIELRQDKGITINGYENTMTQEGIKTYNPCFDVTEHDYITAIVTEKGIIYPPYDKNLPKIFK